ncbi:uncharacterized protein [Penaeus vannamei]|uniref:uncharacterized protein n=1 Tax=Penaeus vannamei TaxID=6689 RepID=UPI00387F6D85
MSIDIISSFDCFISIHRNFLPNVSLLRGELIPAHESLLQPNPSIPRCYSEGLHSLGGKDVTILSSGKGNSVVVLEPAEASSYAPLTSDPTSSERVGSLFPGGESLPKVQGHQLSTPSFLWASQNPYDGRASAPRHILPGVCDASSCDLAGEVFHCPAWNFLSSSPLPLSGLHLLCPWCLAGDHDPTDSSVCVVEFLSPPVHGWRDQFPTSFILQTDLPYHVLDIALSRTRRTFYNDSSPNETPQEIYSLRRHLQTRLLPIEHSAITWFTPALPQLRRWALVLFHVPPVISSILVKQAPVLLSVCLNINTLYSGGNSNTLFCHQWDTGHQMDWKTAHNVFPSTDVHDHRLLESSLIKPLPNFNLNSGFSSVNSLLASHFLHLPCAGQPSHRPPDHSI